MSHIVKIIAVETGPTPFNGVAPNGESYTVYDARVKAIVDGGEEKRIAVKTGKKEWADALAGKTFEATRIERGNYVGYRLVRLVPQQAAPAAEHAPAPVPARDDREDIILAQTCLKVAAEQFEPIKNVLANVDDPDFESIDRAYRDRMIEERAKDILSLASALYHGTKEICK